MTNRPQTSAGRNFRRFGYFLLGLVLACGLFILTTNGLYYWFSQPLRSTFTSTRSRLLVGMPAEARTEAERLAFYDSCLHDLADLPWSLDQLNRQLWTTAVLLKTDPDPAAVQALLDQAAHGRAAVAAYFSAISAIRQDLDALSRKEVDPAADQSSLPERLQAYTDRIQAAEKLESAYADLGKIEHIDLAGPLLTPDELGLTAITADIQTWRQSVSDLQNILTASDELELRINALYEQDPSAQGLEEMKTACANLLAEQQTLIKRTNGLPAGLPQPLLAALQIWRNGLDNRTAFIEHLQVWWENAVKAENSLESAATDRATAKRYIQESLNETNVETAYLWTRTAQEYRVSMNSAIDFANIAIGKTNQQLGDLAEIRQAYRTALGFDAEVRQISELAAIQADAFWLEG